MNSVTESHSVEGDTVAAAEGEEIDVQAGHTKTRGRDTMVGDIEDIIDDEHDAVKLRTRKTSIR